jgi:dTDP-L-rhamnose 4-epimerase
LKVLVTGGAGFIGSHIVDALVRRGDAVLVVDSLDQGVFQQAPAYLNPSVEYCFADLRSVRFDGRFDGVEAIVHLAALGGVGRAAKEPANLIEANAYGTARLVEAAAGLEKLRRVILCSSFSVYGTNYTYRCEACGAVRDAARTSDDLAAGRFEVPCLKCGKSTDIVPITEGATPNPLEIYGASKYMQELSFRGFTAAELTTFRFSSVYGTRLRLDDGEATIIAKLAGWIQSGRAPKLFEDGKQIRDWVYVGDIVDAALAILGAKDAPPVINICSGAPTTLSGACDILAHIMETNCPPDVVGGFRPGDMRHCLGDASTLATLLGRPPVAFPEGARLTFGRDASRR